MLPRLTTKTAVVKMLVMSDETIYRRCKVLLMGHRGTQKHAWVPSHLASLGGSSVRLQWSDQEAECIVLECDTLEVEAKMLPFLRSS